jgi:hypothetical protein
MDNPPIERMEHLAEINNIKKMTISQKKRELEDFEKQKNAEIAALEKKKLKEIEEIEQKKKHELDSLAEKKKELEELQDKKVREIEETEDLIDQSFQDLMRHKKQILEQEDNDNIKNLERMASASASSANDTHSRGPNKGANYSRFFEELEKPKHIYDMANSGFYNNLAELRNRAAQGEITPQEEEFVEQLKGQFMTFEKKMELDNMYSEADKNQYIRRSMSIINQIASYSQRREGNY